MDDEDSKGDGEPLDSGRLSSEQGQRLVDLLNEKIPDLKCELCGSTEFTVNPHLASPIFVTMDADGNTEQDWRVSHPCALTHCTGCGNTKFHSLRMLNFNPHAGEDK